MNNGTGDLDKEQEEQCLRTMMMMEYGLLDLNKVFDYGILLFGKTKAGKTTTSHYLTNQVLEGAKNDQGYITYQLKASDKKVE
jgi:Cdc6-like AAA superfamily ATPase